MDHFLYRNGILYAEGVAVPDIAAVVGTPFYGHPVMTEVGKALVEFGCAYVCIWPDQAPITGLARTQGEAHGAA